MTEVPKIDIAIRTIFSEYSYEIIAMWRFRRVLGEATTAIRGGASMPVSSEKQPTSKEDWMSAWTTSRPMVLIYAVALFDSYLNNLTRLCLWTFPEIGLKNRDFPLSALLSKHREELIHEQLEKRAAELGRETYRFRIDFIKRIIGGDSGILTSEFDRLKKIARVRNQMIHERGGYSFQLNSDLQVSSLRSVTAEELPQFEEQVLEIIAAKLLRYLMLHLAKKPLSAEMQEMVDTMIANSTTT